PSLKGAADAPATDGLAALAGAPPATALANSERPAERGRVRGAARAGAGDRHPHDRRLPARGGAGAADAAGGPAGAGGEPGTVRGAGPCGGQPQPGGAASEPGN